MLKLTLCASAICCIASESTLHDSSGTCTDLCARRDHMLLLLRAGVFMQELSLAGNMLTQLPDCIGNLTQLQKLQLSGNRLSQLPDSIGSLSRLEVRLSVAASPRLKLIAG